MRGDLSERLPIAGSDDELDRLSESLNAMLARIEHLLAGMQEVSHNIAHDLRTPLNRLRNRVEAALHARGGEEAARDALEKTIEEADGLIKTFNALLSIARLESGSAENEMRAVDLHEIVRDVAELYEPAAEQQGARIVIRGAQRCIVQGNRQLLGQAVANLIDNALKYATSSAVTARGEAGVGTGEKRPCDPAGSALEMTSEISDITVELRCVDDTSQPGQPSQAAIVVADHGPGIAAHERDRALQRFTRLAASRSRPGSGLGLSLVSAVANRHGGALRLEDNHPGLRVVLLLKRRQD